jgi:hypothetical protein
VTITTTGDDVGMNSQDDHSDFTDHFPSQNDISLIQSDNQDMMNQSDHRPYIKKEKMSTSQSSNESAGDPHDDAPKLNLFKTTKKLKMSTESNPYMTTKRSYDGSFKPNLDEDMPVLGMMDAHDQFDNIGSSIGASAGSGVGSASLDPRSIFFCSKFSQVKFSQAIH